MSNFTVNWTPEGKALRKEVSRLSSIANKRLGRLKLQGYTDTPSYKSWEENGGLKFGVRGKSPQEVQREYWRVKNFLDNRTSTVRGANNYLKEIASHTGMSKYPIDELKKDMGTFFSLAQRISEYDKSLGESARALNYQKIWEQINTLIEQDKINLSLASNAKDKVEALDDMLSQFIKAFR